MSEFKGTKGEWIYRETVTSSNNGVEKIGVFNKNKQGFFDKSVCSITVYDSLNESEANAKLIACAPEMLEMLEDVLYAYDMGTLEYVNFESIKTLIKKATE